MFETAEIVPLIMALIDIASVLAMRTSVEDGLHQCVGAGRFRRACSGSKQTCAPELTTAPGMSTSKPPHAEGMETQMLSRGPALKDALAAATKDVSNNWGSASR